jgi:2-polyprenyl-3-methyl-5-hydroxy-6-metoxy-1,4-benzoquinol methylase
MYFDAMLIWSKIKDGNVLHFAPERILSPKISQAKPATYVKADLFPVSKDIAREDITRLSFSDCLFDLVIANHILEHVSDDHAAMKEIFRVLKPGGLAILQTPYSNISFNRAFQTLV